MKAVALMLALLCAHAGATTPRGTEAPRLFRKANACPATKLFTGPCVGWTMDHMVPLACNGPDTPQNLQWQTVAEAKAKDKIELQCWRYFQGGK